MEIVPRNGVAIDPRPHLSEGVALLGNGHCQSLDRLVDRFGVVNFAGFRQKLVAGRLGVEVGQRRLDVDRAESHISAPHQW